MIGYGSLELKYSMRLWIQIMRALALKHESNVFYGCMSPEMIRIDMQNNIDIDEPHTLTDAYTAPEVSAGQAPGPHSDVYAMGVILFEMVTGSLEHLGARKPSDLVQDTPSWLDDLIMKCTKKDRRDRFLNTKEISSTLVKLKNSL
jgi:serine/threonine protein kinase